MIWNRFFAIRSQGTNVNLTDNPIFLTQKRLGHRAGVLAAILIATLIGASLLSGLVAYLIKPIDFDFRTPQEAGESFYSWIIGIEILMVVLGGFGRICQSLANERKAGLWDSNRLTPLKPCELIFGYWFGSPLREFYMGAVMAGFGLLTVLLSHLPITLWLGTQILIASTALFVGLAAFFFGLVFSRPQAGLMVVALIFLFPLAAAAPNRLLTNFLLPIYGIVHLFYNGIDARYEAIGWTVTPNIFGVPVPAIVLTLGLQLAVGTFLWRATIRKIANPFHTSLCRWEAIVLFAIMVLTQYGLIWDLWRGYFQPMKILNGSDSIMLPAAFCGTLLLGVAILAFDSPPPEKVRIEALRKEINEPAKIFQRSAVSMALILTVIGAVGMLTQCINSLWDSWKVLAVTTGNLLDCFLVFSLLLEFCRLRFKRRAVGFAALWLFVICILPLILAAVFTTSSFAWISLLSPGVLAFSQPDGYEMNCLLGIVAAHFGIVLVLLLLWRREWAKFLAKASGAS